MLTIDKLRVGQKSVTAVLINRLKGKLKLALRCVNGYLTEIE